MNAENADKNYFCHFFQKICVHLRAKRSASKKAKCQVARIYSPADNFLAGADALDLHAHRFGKAHRPRLLHADDGLRHAGFL